MTGEMSDRAFGDDCPSCGSRDAVPWAVDYGVIEMFGYRCGLCQHIWPVMCVERGQGTLAVRPARMPAE